MGREARALRPMDPETFERIDGTCAVIDESLTIIETAGPLNERQAKRVALAQQATRGMRKLFRQLRADTAALGQKR